MKTLFVFLIGLGLFTGLGLSADKPKKGKGHESFQFKGQKRSLIKWDSIAPGTWLDFKLWREERNDRDKFPPWEILKKERRLRERIGHGLDCFGSCKLFRGRKHGKIQFRSPLREGDEIVTGKDSFLWVALLDGTMLRLSPHTSFSLREINISKEDIFIHGRVNFGNILWISRSSSLVKTKNQRETDSVFFPLDFYNANPIPEVKKLKEEDLYSFLEKEKTILNQYMRLNQLIEQNNKHFKNKRTLPFIVFPNGHLFGENISFEVIVLLGGKTYLKRRSSEQLGLKEDQPEADVEAEVYLRGFNQFQGKLLDEGQWFEIDKKGSELGIADPKMERKFGLGEFVTSRIPSILVARELLLQRYSKFLFDPKLNREILAQENGFRLWDNFSLKKKSDLFKRFAFLLEYTRRAETTSLRQALKLRKRLEKRGEKWESMTYGRVFYGRAIRNFYQKRSTQLEYSSDREVLNSTLRPFWSRINEVKR